MWNDTGSWNLPLGLWIGDQKVGNGLQLGQLGQREGWWVGE